MFPQRNQNLVFESRAKGQRSPLVGFFGNMKLPMKLSVSNEISASASVDFEYTVIILKIGNLSFVTAKKEI